MAEDPLINEAATAEETTELGNPTVSVRASADTTEEDLRADAERHLPEGWRLGELARTYADGDEVVFEFDAVGE